MGDNNIQVAGVEEAGAQVQFNIPVRYQQLQPIGVGVQGFVWYECFAVCWKIQI